MTERGSRSLSRSVDRFAVGPSRAAWEDGRLVVDVDEIAMVPFGRRAKGRVTIEPLGLPETAFALDPRAFHVWQPIAPSARVRVELERPSVAWEGLGYLDANAGAEPLETRFSDWEWSRAHRGEEAFVLYDARRRCGGETSLALRFPAAGGVEAIEPPPPAALPPAASWRVARATRSDPGYGARVAKTLEDTPFYARSLVETSIAGAPATAMHESLSLDRYSRSWVKLLLPFRMPRRV